MGVMYSSNTTQPGDVVTYDIYVDLAISQLYSVMYSDQPCRVRRTLPPYSQVHKSEKKSKNESFLGQP